MTPSQCNSVKNQTAAKIFVAQHLRNCYVHERFTSPLKGISDMNSLTLDIPDNLASETEAFVTGGVFGSQKEVVIAALADFMRHYRPVLMDQFAREDIQWAKTLKTHTCEA
jgi:hypothetical protein